MNFEPEITPSAWLGSNHILNIHSLSYDPWAFRHGEAASTKAGKVVSDPARGVLEEFGLTEKGRAEVHRSALNVRESLPNGVEIIIVCSPFSRTKDTADILGTVFECTPRVDERLRERFFGELEGEGVERYSEVWTRDLHNPTHTHYGVEPVISVLSRMTGVMKELEGEFAGNGRPHILLVSHGDPLQIALKGVQKGNPGRHRQIAPLRTAELRKMIVEPYSPLD